MAGLFSPLKPGRVALDMVARDELETGTCNYQTDDETESCPVMRHSKDGTFAAFQQRISFFPDFVIFKFARDSNDRNIFVLARHTTRDI